MKAIQFSVAVLLLLMSAAAAAKGPAKDQLVVTPPFSSARHYQVTWLNISESPVELTVQFFDHLGDPLTAPLSWTPSAGYMGWVAYDLVSVSNMGYAHVSWYGNEKDLMLTVCSFDNWSTPTFRSCVKAN